MYDIDDLIEPRKKGKNPRDPFAQRKSQVKEGKGENFQYDILGQFHPEGEEFGQKYQEKSKGRRAHIEYMSPEDYFNTVDKGFRSRVPYNKQSEVMPQTIDNYKSPDLVKAAKRGDKFAMPWIEYREGAFDGQEGRHRASMAKDLGVEQMPVVISDERREYKDDNFYLNQDKYRSKKKKNPFTYDDDEVDY